MHIHFIYAQYLLGYSNQESCESYTAWLSKPHNSYNSIINNNNNTPTVLQILKLLRTPVPLFNQLWKKNVMFYFLKSSRHESHQLISGTYLAYNIYI